MIQAYGGDEGWAFIEDGCYKLIIDTILPERENSKREETQQLLVGDSSMKVIELLFVKFDFNSLYLCICLLQFLGILYMCSMYVCLVW